MGSQGLKTNSWEITRAVVPLGYWLGPFGYAYEHMTTTRDLVYAYIMLTSLAQPR